MNYASSCVIAAGFLIGGSVHAEALMDRDNGPFTALFGFPDSSEGSRLTVTGTGRWATVLTTSSHSTGDSGNGEAVLIDGETNRLGISWRRGMSDRLELGVELPWILHDSGNLDAFLDGWHSFFGLPEGIRGERPRDQLLFRYEDEGDSFVLNRSSNGIGDLRILAGWQLRKTADSSTALRLGVKLPTGDSDRLLGSGAVDISIGIAGDRSMLVGLERLSGFYRINATWLGRQDVLPRRNNPLVGQLSAGLGYAVTDRTEVAIQAVLRSRVYDSAIAPLGDVAAALTAGIRFRLSRRYRLSFAVGEDIHPDSWPDVTFLLSVESRGGS